MYLTMNRSESLRRTRLTQARSAKGIKVIFRGVNKDNPEKAIVIVQALKGVLGKHIQENSELFEKNGAVMSTAEPSLWS